MSRVREHLPHLDGVRGLAILLVLWGHIHIHRFVHPLMWFNENAGVDLFFVLSGFLITRILLYNRENGIPLQRFWRRRAARIFPIYFLALAAITLVWPSENIFYAASFTWNFRYPMVTPVSPIGPYWSLCVEEQYYAIWPLLVLLLPVAWSRRACVAMLIVSICSTYPVYILAGHFHLRPHAAIEYFTVTRCTMLMVGSFFAFAEPYLTARRVRTIVAAGLIWWLAIGLAWFWQLPLFQEVGLHLQRYLMVTVVFAFSMQPANRIFRKLLEGWPLRYTGKISYGLYIFHLPVYWILRLNGPKITGRPIDAAFALVVVFSMAAASWSLVEAPILRWARGREQVASEPVVL